MIKTQKFRTEDITAHVDVALETYDRPEVIDKEHLTWKHLDGPFGPSDAIILLDDKISGRLHGRSFIMPRPFVTNADKTISAGTVADLVLRPESRNAGRLVAMVKATKELKTNDLVIHSSNEVSDIFYRKMFKFPVRFSLASAGLPVRLKSYVLKSGKGALLSHVADVALLPARTVMPFMRLLTEFATGLKLGDQPDQSEMEVIHEAHHARTGPQFLRSAEYVEWRYLSGPISHSDVVGLYKKGEGSLGYAAFRRVEIDGIKFCILMDLITKRALSALELIAFKFAMIDRTREAGDDIAFVMFNPENLELAKLASFPFVSVPDSTLPHPTPIFLHQRNNVLSEEAAKTLFFMVGDLDYF